MLEELAIATGYTVVALPVMKYQYNHLRNKEIDDDIAKGRSLENALRWQKEFREAQAIPAIFTGLLWPVAVPLVFGTRGLMRWFDSSPRKSNAEIEAERKVMQKRIAELERELKL